VLTQLIETNIKQNIDIDLFDQVCEGVKIPCDIRFISCEPMLAPLMLGPWLKKLQWVICGGESGNKKTIRPTLAVWAQQLHKQ
jgi:protein gp37